MIHNEAGLRLTISQRIDSLLMGDFFAKTWWHEHVDKIKDVNQLQIFSYVIDAGYGNAFYRRWG